MMISSRIRSKKVEKEAVLYVGGVAVEGFMVDSVLGYGAEVWASEILCSDPLSNDCERVHLFALKWMFGVRKSTASCVVLAEAVL